MIVLHGKDYIERWRQFQNSFESWKLSGKAVLLCGRRGKKSQNFSKSIEFFLTSPDFATIFYRSFYGDAPVSTIVLTHVLHVGVKVP